MTKWLNGNIVEMTAEEAAAQETAWAAYEAAEHRRPLTAEEVTAMLIRQQINTLEVDDSTALRMAAYYPEWAADVDYSAGYKVQRGGKLWRCIQAHNSQDSWAPSTDTASLWERIDETHTGDQYDPIPAARSMEYTYGLYYADPEDGKVYLCTRTGEADGGTVTLHYLPHELVGLYMEEVVA